MSNKPLNPFAFLVVSADDWAAYVADNRDAFEAEVPGWLAAWAKVEANLDADEAGKTHIRFWHYSGWNDAVMAAANAPLAEIAGDERGTA